MMWLIYFIKINKLNVNKYSGGQIKQTSKAYNNNDNNNNNN